MPYKLALLCYLLVCVNNTYAQEEILPIDLIELLGELDDNEMRILEKAITDIETLPFKDKQHGEDLGVANENSTQ